MGIGSSFTRVFAVRHIVRIAFLPLLVLALTGPWMYERIHVPAPHACAAPYVRLDDDFCGTPFSVAAYYPMLAGELANLVGMFVHGEADAVSIGFLAVMLLLVLPFFTTLLMTVREDGRYRRIFHGAVLLLAFAAVLLFIGAERTPGQVWLWGTPLYLALTGGLFVFEVMLLLRKPAQPG